MGIIFLNLHILMSMLHAFLLGDQGEKDLFEGLAIEEAGEAYLQERGKRPVIYLSFKDIKGSTWDRAFRQIRTLLARMVDQHYDDAIEALALPDRSALAMIRTEQASETKCQDALKILTQLLSIQHGENPWVLIDEYDTPMQNAYQHGYYSEMRELMQGLLGQCLKDNNSTNTTNPFLHRAVLTGILRVAKEDIFSGLNNFGCYGVLQKKFSRHFGFSPQEVNQLLDQKNLGDQKEAVRMWYNGYQFGEHTRYNPWSIISFVGSGEAEPKLYWVNTSNNHLVHVLLARATAEVKRGLSELLDHPAGHTVEQVVGEYVPLGKLIHNARNIWGILLASGYLTVTQRSKIPGRSDFKALLRVPNEEVLSVYGDLVHAWLEGTDSTSGYTVLDYLLVGELASFAQEFSTFFQESASYFDVGTNAPEKFYHGFILGMLQYVKEDFLVLSQRESGVGRYDIALEPKDKTKPGFILEFKRCPGIKGTIEEIQAYLAPSAQQALDQIKSKDYTSQLFAAGVETVHALGLAFSGKEVKVVWETMHSS